MTSYDTAKEMERVRSERAELLAAIRRMHTDLIECLMGNGSLRTRYEQAKDLATVIAKVEGQS